MTTYYFVHEKDTSGIDRILFGFTSHSQAKKEMNKYQERLARMLPPSVMPYLYIEKEIISEE